jgi:hypothetical protein
MCCSPFFEVIPNTAIRSEEDITKGKTRIREIVTSLGNSKIMLTCILEDSGVGRAPFPPAENIHKQHGKIACCEDILSDKAFSVSIPAHSVCTNPCIEMGAVNCSTAVTEVGVELRIVFDFVRGLIGRKMDVFLIEATNEAVKDRVN